MKLCQKKIGDRIFCERILEVTGKTATVRDGVCKNCHDNGYSIILATLTSRIISSNTNLHKWSKKLKDFAGEEEVKKAMIIALKKGNRKIDDIINVSEELNIVDKNFIKELILIAANYGGCDKNYLLDIVKKYKLDKD